MKFEKVTFSNPRGDKLVGRLDLPIDGNSCAYALFAHCFTCTKNIKAAGHISSALNAQGIAVLRFDFAGIGESDGDFADTNFSSNVEDLVAAAKFLEVNYKAPTILIGHSLGGAAVLQAAAKIPSSLAVVTIGAPYEPSHLAHIVSSQMEQIQNKGSAEISIAGRTFEITKQFLDDLDNSKMDQVIGNLDRALLVLHSPVDVTVGVEHAAAIFKAAKHPKSFVSLDHADHLLSSMSDSRYVGGLIAAWAAKYIEKSVLDEKKEPLVGGRVIARL